MKNFFFAQGTKKNIPIISSFHRMMFEEINRIEGRESDDSFMSELEREFGRYLEKQLGSGSVHIFTAVHGNTIVAGSVLSILSVPPTMINFSGRRGLIHTVFTVPEFRRKGLATELTKMALQRCREEKVAVVELGASKAGRPIYEALGFEVSNNRLFLYLS